MAAALPQLGRGVLVGRRGPPCGGADLTPRKRHLLWRRPVPERGSPVNRGNRPPCDNGEGEEWPSPLPTIRNVRPKGYSQRRPRVEAFVQTLNHLPDSGL